MTTLKDIRQAGLHLELIRHLPARATLQAGLDMLEASLKLPSTSIVFKSVTPALLVAHREGEAEQRFQLDPTSPLARAITIAWLVVEYREADLSAFLMPGEEKYPEDQLRRAYSGRVKHLAEGGTKQVAGICQKFAKAIRLPELIPVFASFEVRKDRVTYEPRPGHPRIITGLGAVSPECRQAD